MATLQLNKPKERKLKIAKEGSPSIQKLVDDLCVLCNWQLELLRTAGKDRVLSNVEMKTILDLTKAVNNLASEQERIRKADQYARLTDDELLDLMIGVAKNNPDFKAKLAQEILNLEIMGGKSE